MIMQLSNVQLSIVSYVFCSSSSMTLHTAAVHSCPLHTTAVQRCQRKVLHTAVLPTQGTAHCRAAHARYCTLQRCPRKILHTAELPTQDTAHCSAAHAIYCTLQSCPRKILLTAELPTQGTAHCSNSARSHVAATVVGLAGRHGGRIGWGLKCHHRRPLNNTATEMPSVIASQLLCSLCGVIDAAVNSLAAVNNKMSNAIDCNRRYKSTISMR